MTDKGAIERVLEFYRPKGVRIDLGCGGNKQPGFLGIDMRELPGVDIVHDLEEFPWPLPDECAELIVASHLVEHINPARGGFLKFMDECWRILLPGGKMMISAPYAGSPGYWQDPTHCNGCSEVTWAYFDPIGASQDNVLYKIYKPKPWKILQNTYTMAGNLEVGLEKRMEDETYGVR